MRSGRSPTIRVVSLWFVLPRAASWSRPCRRRVVPMPTAGFRTQSDAPCCHCMPRGSDRPPSRAWPVRPHRRTGYAKGMAHAPRSTDEPTRNTADEGEPSSPADLPRASLVAVLKRARVEFKRDNLTDLAAALTYYGLLSIVPTLIVLVAALGLLGPDTTTQVVNQVQAIAPGSSANFVETLISQAQANRTGAGLGAIIGLLVALWSASGYVSAFMRASNVVYDIPEGRPIWKTVPIRVGLTLLAIVVMVVGAVIVVVSGPVAEQIGDLVGAGSTTLLVWSVLKWPVLLILVSVLFAILFWASPNAKQGGVRWVSPGGIIAVVIWLVVSGLFAVYVTHFSSYNKTYGSLAGIVVFLVWLWLTNIAILLGAEVNAELERSRAIAEGIPEDLEPFAEPRDTRSMTDIDKQAVAQAAERRPG